MRQLMGRLFNVIFISLIYTGIVIILDAVAIYYFKLNAPVTIVVTTFLVLFGLSFAYVDTTKRSERHFAERRKAQAQGATFSMMWDALDLDAKQLFYQKIDVESASSEFKSRYQQLQNEISYWDKEIERLR
ncbi:hypothetical protein [Raoultella ornithinolytica]|uniref:hypothetical protein n=1 Tax=Raoultella ornithinolytica TaxID=54291 RepID=UPI002DB67D83|nr:hypothetical protein [Raoultella ornithinolytica]MEB5728052.1 hypothetical protein [Raoultella ornithinolytica]